MKIIFNTERILKHRKYGNSVFRMLSYKFIKNIFAFFSLFIWGMLLCLFISMGYITQFTYEQFIIVITVLCSLFLKKENQYAIIPYLIRIPKIEIRKYILIKESISEYNFILLPLIIPLFLINKVEWPANNASIFLFINSYLVGLFINLFIRIVKFFCNKNRLCYLTTIAIVSIYIIVLVITRHRIIEFSYLSLLCNYYSIMILFIGVFIMIPFYMYVIKQEMYQVYDSNIRYKSIRFFELQPMLDNTFNKLFVLQLIRCKGARKFLQSILLFITGGLLLYLFMDFKLIGLSIYIGAYTLNMIQFTIYSNSDYFDTLYTKPISMKSLLLNAFYTHLCVTGILFVLLFIYIAIYDNQFILPFISIYLYMSGPMAFILLFNILFAQNYDLYSVESEFTIRRTFAQKIIGFIAGGSLFVILAIIQFFSTIGCYIVITVSIIVIMTHHYWIRYLYEQFMNRRYQIMKNLRK
jgi:hypothetical protein